MWILGDAFMRGWYHIHDFENKRQGFVPTKLTSKRAPYKEATHKTVVVTGDLIVPNATNATSQLAPPRYVEWNGFI